LKLVGIKKEPEENQGSIFDLKKENEYQEVLKIVKELVGEKEKLKLAKFLAHYKQVYEIQGKCDLIKHVNL